MELSCLVNYFTKYEDKFEKVDGLVYLNITDEVIWEFHSQNSFWVEYDNGIVTDHGKWKCVGEENYEIKSDKNNRYFSSELNTWGDPEENSNTNLPTQLDSEFSCVIKGLTSLRKPFQIKDNIYVVSTISPGTNWFFYQPKQGTKTWVEVNNKTITLQGTWSCVGETNFQLTRSDGKIYVGGDTSWKEATQAEPTYDKSKFPLKLDSRGPEVVQLQNYLNKLIPFEPLVVNGIFDKKTQDKLIQLQKNLPI